MKTLQQELYEITSLAGSKYYGLMLNEDQIVEVVRSWLIQKRTHFIGKHKFCDDVKQSMDELLEELQK